MAEGDQICRIANALDALLDFCFQAVIEAGGDPRTVRKSVTAIEASTVAEALNNARFGSAHPLWRDVDLTAVKSS